MEQQRKKTFHSTSSVVSFEIVLNEICFHLFLSLYICYPTPELLPFRYIYICKFEAH